MSLIAVETVLVGSKPPAVDDSLRTSMGGRCGFGVLASLLTRASPSHFSGAGGSGNMPKLVKLVGPSSTLVEELSLFLTQSATEAPSARV